MWIKIMRCIFLMTLVLVVSGCFKVEKKSDLKNQEDGIEEMSIQTEKIIAQEWSLKQNEVIRVDRLILKETARIYTNQYDLRIETKELVSERGAEIKNFPLNNQANENANGLDGGTIDIKTLIAIGNLQVKINGQNGGNGSSGWTGKSHTTFLPSMSPCQPMGGASGGKTGSFFFQSGDASAFSLSTSLEKSMPGKSGHMVDGLNLVSKRDRKTCNILPVPGLPGQAGQICLKMSSAALSVCK